MRVERKIPDYVLDNLDNLKEEAKRQGYTIKALAEKTGLTISTLCGMANGNAPAAQPRYNKLAEVLNWEAWQ